MVFHSPHFHIFLILQCLLALLPYKESTSVLAESEKENSSINISQLIEELRRESDDHLRFHLDAMFTSWGCDERLYNLTVEVPLECLHTIRAATIMKMQLAIGKEVDNLQKEAEISAAANISALADTKNGTRLRHPLEFVCPIFEKLTNEKSHLKAAFERAKIAVQNNTTNDTKRQPPLSQKIFNNSSDLACFMLEKFRMPKFTRLITSESFHLQLNESMAFSRRMHLFVTSAVSVARKEKFADPMQSIYDKVLNEMVLQISPKFKWKEMLRIEKKKRWWWLTQMAQTFYSCVQKDQVLKEELENTASTVFKNSTEDDLDFSKF